MCAAFRLVVLADVHGNLPALEAVLDDLPGDGIDGIIVAGDYLACPHPVETIQRLRSLGCMMIKGNAEIYALLLDRGSAPESMRTGHQWALTRWTFRRLSREMLDFLAALPEHLVIDLPGADPIRVVHGSPRDSAESILPDRDPGAVDDALAQIGEPVLVCAHTHVPWVEERDGRMALNPGAVCGPLNGEVGAQYALLSWGGDRWQVEHRTVPYDLRRIRSAFEGSGLLDEGGALARAFLLSIETGRDIAADFLTYACSLAGEDWHRNYRVIPDAVWEQAAATFDWDAAVHQYTTKDKGS